jgi:hypothetical protein
MTVRFRLKGRPYAFDRSEIEGMIGGLIPDPASNGRTTHYVLINNTLYPVKQAVSAISGLQPILFTTSEACNILRRADLPIMSDEGGKIVPAISVANN